MNTIDIEQLRDWFLQTKRDFPWREDSDPDPYRVWISEVMLQQTQASRVLLFYDQWIQRFPSIFSLASATLDEVMKAWEGLGYYSRVKALHDAAKDLVKNHKGLVPETKEELLKIKGLGEYTSSAILAFGFHKKEAPCDTNVLRVFCRFFHIEDDIAKQKTQLSIRKQALQQLPEEKPWEIAESFIELGAVLCRPKNPKCHICPLQENCKSYRLQTQDKIPFSSKKTLFEKLDRTVCIIMVSDSILVQQVPENKPCGGLFEFPYFDTKISHTVCQELLYKDYGITTSYSQTFQTIDQSFTKYRVKLYPHLFYAEKKPTFDHFKWHTFQYAKTLTFSSGHKKILNLLPC